MGDVILRVDDFPFTKKDERWRHNLDTFKRFDEVLERSGVPSYYLGVIPRWTTDQDMQWIRSNPRVRVSLHGVDHDERFPNEFRDFESSDDIKNKIVEAKSRLFFGTKKKIDSYIPPHNVINVRTCLALRDLGFKTIFGGPGTEGYVADAAREMGLEFHNSEWPWWYGRSDELLERDRAYLRILSYSGPTKVLTLHWTWETNIGLESLERFLDLIRPVW